MTITIRKWKPAYDGFKDRAAVDRAPATYAVEKDGQIVAFIEGEVAYMRKTTWRILVPVEGQTPAVPSASARAYASTLAVAKEKAVALWA